MKKKIFIIAAFFGLALGMTSCSDILDTDSDRQAFDPDLDQKTDSMFYTLGILRSVQQAADQYVLVNEMRGDLTATTYDTSEDLRELANFSADATNKYDSAYVYYRIINGCNYYVAHRDTSLRTGSRRVAIPEYVQAKSIRAWAYLQLTKTYGAVPFYLDPITTISQAEAQRERQDPNAIYDQLIADLKPWSGTAVPNYGQINCGNLNNGTAKNVASSLTMFPVDLVLGDLYLEKGDYTNAAVSYFTYLRANNKNAVGLLSGSDYYPNRNDLPRNVGLSRGNWFANTFSVGAAASTDVNTEVITVVPFAVNRLRGTVTSLPRIFGYDYYTTDVDSTSGGTSYTQYKTDNEIDPSVPYTTMSANQQYYYTTEVNDRTVYNSLSIGDMRRWASFNTGQQGDSTLSVMTKFNSGNVPIYRVGVVFLRLAEAMNRMGYPDAAFAVLKDGISREIINDTINYSYTTKAMLSTTVPFLSTANISNFDASSGIHYRGCERVSGMNNHMYSFNNMVWQPAVEMLKTELHTTLTAAQDSVLYSLYMGQMVTDSVMQVAGLDSTIVSDLLGIHRSGELMSSYSNDGTLRACLVEVTENLLCDENALEAAFEGHRYSDLTRFAAHKNASNPIGNANYGSEWLARKLAYKHPLADLTNPANWYLPFRH